MQATVSPTPAVKLYERARGHVERGHLDLAYELLAEAFGYGLPNPMQVVSDPTFAPLLADSTWRPKVRDLIHRHAWESNAVMAPPSVPGRRVVVAVRLEDEGATPVSRAVVDLRQADARHPCGPDSTWNPVLFASLRSDDSGRVAVETILPDTQGLLPGCPPSRHLHLTAERQGFESCRGVVLLAADSTSATPEDASWGTTWVAEKAGVAASRQDYAVVLRMRRTP